MGSLGMTLVELVIALTVFGVIISVTLAFVSQQNAAFQTSLERMSALRNARYVITNLSQNLETLGTNVPSNQPALIYADHDVVTFSADYATNVSGDPFAVFHDPDAPIGEVRAPSAPFVIPTTSVMAADSAYEVGTGVPSPAEILSVFFLPDTATARSDDFVLYRQVNGSGPEVIARNLLRDDTTPFLQFEREVVDVLGSGLEAVPSSDLPIHHSAPIHLSAADTGSFVLADSVRLVRVTLVATNGLSGDEQRTVRIERSIALPNAAESLLSTCGSAPIFGETLTATVVTLTGGEKAVELEWNPAMDEVGGESDVARYVLWRRASGHMDWGEPFMAIPAGAPAYTYTDAAVASGTSYEFAVAAQDCTPKLSSLSASSTVTVP